jgi:hypothetical protein
MKMAGRKPSDPALARGRYEVTGYGPEHLGPTGAKRRLEMAEMARFATETAARRYAAEVLNRPGVDLVAIDHVAPMSSRYPDGPWNARRVDTLRAS